MPNLCQCFKRFAGNILCGRIGQDHTTMLLQRDQIVYQTVIFQIAHNRRVVLIVGGICLPDLLNQLLHSFIDRFVHSLCFTPIIIMLRPFLHRGLLKSDLAYSQRISVSMDSFLRDSR